MLHYYTAIILLSILAMIVVQFGINDSHTLTESRKKLFHKLFNAIIIAAFCEWLGNCLQGTGSSTRILHIVVKAMEFTVAPSIAFFISWIVDKKNQKIIYAYLFIHGVIECLSGVFGFIYSVDQQSNYSHGSFYWIYMLSYMISIIYCIYIVLVNLKKYQYNGMLSFLSMVAFMLTGIVVQLCNSELRVDYVTLGIASIMLYVFTLEMIYQTDELTELINRRGFENYITHIEAPCLILFLDVDDFKKINDTYGHAAGDQILHTLGKTVKIHYAKYGKCFRYGGDEFCVILTDHLEKADTLNQQLIKDVTIQQKHNPVLPNISIGYAHYDPENQSIQDAIEQADQMMYEQKRIKKK